MRDGVCVCGVCCAAGPGGGPGLRAGAEGRRREARTSRFDVLSRGSISFQSFRASPVESHILYLFYKFIYVVGALFTDSNSSKSFE